METETKDMKCRPTEVWEFTCGVASETPQAEVMAHVHKILGDFEKDHGVVMTAFVTRGHVAYPGKFSAIEDAIMVKLSVNPLRATEEEMAAGAGYMREALKTTFLQSFVMCHMFRIVSFH